MPAKQNLRASRTKKVASKPVKMTRGPASSVSRRASSVGKRPAASRRDLSSLSPLVKKDSLSIPIYSLAGRVAGSLSLPKEVFGAKVNQKLLTQAFRVYSTNQARLPGSTKKRGEVHGTTAKMYRQKGTGRARHGAKTAPIFVGGGVAFGPKPRKNNLTLPQKMRKAALIAAFSDKATEKQIFGLTGIDKATGKTKEVANLIEKVADKKSALIITSERLDKLSRAARNIPGVDVLPLNLVNAYEVLRHQVLILTKEGVEKIK